MCASAGTAKKVAKFDLFAAMAAVDLSAPLPEGVYTPVEEGEEVIGVLSENLQRIARVRDSAFADLEALMNKVVAVEREHFAAHKSEGDHDCEVFLENLKNLVLEGDGLDQRQDRIDRVFWGLVALEFGVDQTQGLTLREGNQVVRSPQQKGAPVMTLTLLRV